MDGVGDCVLHVSVEVIRKGQHTLHSDEAAIKEATMTYYQGKKVDNCLGSTAWALTASYRSYSPLLNISPGLARDTSVP